MARESRITEELSWLKVLFAAAIAIAGGLISWLTTATTIRTSRTIALLLVLLSVGAIVIVRHVYRLLTELEYL